ncbi:MAG: sigma-70 family RNA polymerase sigma factor [Lachnospiraceae bacterium]|nr:sigma-70 family RNA polymerase sigma factor [Lachnospiraceae bacterium]
MDDTEIIDLYWKRDERAIEETDHKYGKYCHTVAYNVLGDHEDSRECVNDTWLRAWKSIPPQRPSVLRAFLAKIARNLAFDRYRARSASKRGGGAMEAVLDELAECADLTGKWNGEALYAASELKEAINRFVGDLPEREGNLFVRRYFFAEEISDIAKRYQMTENNVTVILSRTRKKLRKYLTEGGFIE